jgi:hypothetical protein
MLYTQLNASNCCNPFSYTLLTIQVITLFHKRNVSTHGPYDWMDMQCCMPRQHCTERKDWRHMSDPRVEVLNIFGIQTALGNADFHKESYRTCTLNKVGGLEYCP